MSVIRYWQELTDRSHHINSRASQWYGDKESF